MEIFIGWIAFSFLAGFIASQKGRSGIGFFFLALVLSPLVGIIAAVFATKRDAATEPQLTIKDGRAVRMETTRPCPFCAETIKIEAVVCKHCGRDMPAAQPEAEISGKALDKLLDSGQLRRH